MAELPESDKAGTWDKPKWWCKCNNWCVWQPNRYSVKECPQCGMKRPRRNWRKRSG